MNEKELYFSENFEVITKPVALPNSLENQMVAMGKALARAKKNMTVLEYKCLIMTLTKMNWSKEDNSNTVELSKLEVAEVLGLNYDSTDRSRRLRQVFKNLIHHSWIEIDGEDKEEWDDGFLLTRMRTTKGSIIVYFGEQFMPLLQNLMKDKDFITIWANDIYKFDSNSAYLLFEELRLHCDTSKTNWRTYSTKQLKELFGIPEEGKGSYMHYDAKKEKSVFDRANFEKYVLDVAIREINKGQMIKILPILDSAEWKKGKYYEKLKKYGYVEGYRFKYVVKTRTEPPKNYCEEQLEGQMRLLPDGSIGEE